jgi:hypothetical protein
MPTSALATSYILDIGIQSGGHSGSSNVITYPGPRGHRFPHAVVIDCGDGAATTIRLLQSLTVGYIDHIFIRQCLPEEDRSDLVPARSRPPRRLLSASVLCTQITHQCCDDPGSRRPGIVRPVRGVPQASDTVDSGLGIACAGTVAVDIGPFPLEPRRWREHRQQVDQLHQGALSSGHPIPVCRRGTPA